MTHVLVVDDDRLFGNALARDLGKVAEVVVCADAEQARTVARSQSVDACIVDYRLPDDDGLTLLKQLSALLPDAVLVMTTGYPAPDVAFEAARLGADSFVVKGESEARARFMDAVQRAATRASQRGELTETLLGNSTQIRAIRGAVPALADQDDPILILGESGTGKNLVARALHDASRRADRPFLRVNCPSIQSGLAESELFGYVKNAFTGAHSNRIGLLDAAKDGTLFLDEIGDLPLPLQAKLLDVLDEMRFRPVGSNSVRALRARVIAATNRDLRAAVRRGSFRLDLYQRLEVHVIEVPALRERGEDVLQLAEHFVQAHSHRCGRRPPRLHPELQEALRHYSFVGNVRELSNLIRDAVVRTSVGELGLEHFQKLKERPEAVPEPSHTPIDPRPVWRRTEPPITVDRVRTRSEQQDRARIASVLAKHNGNQSKGAAELGISRHALRRKLKKYGMLS